MAKELLARLVAFDTTSVKTNIPLIEFVEAYLAGHGIASQRVPTADGLKASLFATIGPPGVPGVALSGHTDVVPADAADWESDPFTLTARGDRLYGRGSADMKGFLAWGAHRGYHGLAMPSWERKIRVVGDWVGNFFLGRDIASLDDRETPRAAFEAWASRPKPAVEAAPEAESPAAGQPADAAGPAYATPAEDVSKEAAPVGAGESAKTE